MLDFNHVETHFQLGHQKHQLTIRNYCDPGNTPGFRPHSSRPDPWAYEGADQYFDELSQPSGSTGNYQTADEWLSSYNPDLILFFFGFNAAFEKANDPEKFRNELDALIQHSLSQSYGSKDSTLMVLCSPIPIERKSVNSYALNGIDQLNENLAVITDIMKEVSIENNILFLDLFHPLVTPFHKSTRYTDDGFQLNDTGYQMLAEIIYQKLFGNPSSNWTTDQYQKILEKNRDKNWFWHNLYKTPNGVHVHGRRYEPYGPDNYPAELLKLEQLTAIRDTAVWHALTGTDYNIEKLDKQTIQLPEVETNFNPPGGKEKLTYLYGEEALSTFSLPPGFEIELFASEVEFPDLANPVQLSFDNKNRLWVSVMPSYPHYRPGDARPNDKILILEDRDNDGKADSQITFAEGLHLPIGFEIAPEGVYVSQAPHLKLLIDRDKNDRADDERIILSGFDDHDTHHAISAFTTDPSGAIYMNEGVFLHSNIETIYGPIRGTNGGFFRYDPRKNKLQRIAQLSIPNPWGVAIDQWGQPFFQTTSGPDVYWMTPGQVKPRYGFNLSPIFNLIEDKHRVRPTSGIEFVSSRHFPSDLQGDLLINNTIGFLGIKQHQILDDTTGYSGKFRQDLLSSTDPNFRPVDLEFAPDGSLYFIDWHNILIGHMQHNARDPLRDHSHGRIYRITYPERPLIKPVVPADADIPTLLNLLKEGEYRTRYRAKRELRKRDSKMVMQSLRYWLNNLSETDPKTPEYRLEALWVSWGIGELMEDLLASLLKDPNYRIRTAATQVLWQEYNELENSHDLLMEAAKDPHNRVRLQAIVAASWLPKEKGLEILAETAKHPIDRWMENAYRTSLAHLNETTLTRKETYLNTTKLKGEDYAKYVRGKRLYLEDGYCGSCHQKDGGGLEGIYPPLDSTIWVQGDPDNLIKVTLHGLYGPMIVQGKQYPGQVPMTAFKNILSDDEIADVLTYVRNTFGNEESPVTPDQVARIRAQTKDRNNFYTPEELSNEL